MAKAEDCRGKSGKNIAGVPRNIFFAGLTSFLMDTATKMVYSVMPMFLLSIGASKTQLSLIEGIAESTASFLKAVSGRLSDKIGKNKPLMLLGYALSSIIIPVYSAAVSPFQILYLRFMERVGKGLRASPRDSLIAGSCEAGRTGRSFGLHKAMDNAGAIAGPLIAFAILSVFLKNYRLVFIFAAIPALLGVLNIILFIREAGKKNDELPGKISFRDFPKKYFVFLGIIFVFTLGNSTDTLLLVKANDSGINALYIPLVYLIYNFVSVVFSVPSGILSDRIGRERLIIAGYFLYSIVYFGFGSSSSSSILISLFFLYGLYSAATDGVQKALVSDLIDKNKKGTGLGIYNSLLGVTLLPASLIAGILYDRVGSGTPFYFGSAMSFTAAVMMFLFYRYNRRIAG